MNDFSEMFEGSCKDEGKEPNSILDKDSSASPTERFPFGNPYPFSTYDYELPEHLRYYCDGDISPVETSSPEISPPSSPTFHITPMPTPASTLTHAPAQAQTPPHPSVSTLMSSSIQQSTASVISQPIPLSDPGLGQQHKKQRQEPVFAAPCRTVAPHVIRTLRQVLSATDPQTMADTLNGDKGNGLGKAQFVRAIQGIQQILNEYQGKRHTECLKTIYQKPEQKQVMLQYYMWQIQDLEKYTHITRERAQTRYLSWFQKEIQQLQSTLLPRASNALMSPPPSPEPF